MFVLFVHCDELKFSVNYNSIRPTTIKLIVVFSLSLERDLGQVTGNQCVAKICS